MFLFARMLCALMYRQRGDLANLLKSAQKKVPHSARLSAGGGVQKLFGQCPNAFYANFIGASLTPVSFFWPLWCYWKPLTAFSQALLVDSLEGAAVVAPWQNIAKWKTK